MRRKASSMPLVEPSASGAGGFGANLAGRFGVGGLARAGVGVWVEIVLTTGDLAGALAGRALAVDVAPLVGASAGPSSGSSAVSVSQATTAPGSNAVPAGARMRRTYPSRKAWISSVALSNSTTNSRVPARTKSCSLTSHSTIRTSPPVAPKCGITT